MKFNVYTKQGFPVDPNRLNLAINPANGKIYQNGKNVNDDYIYQPQMDNLTEEQEIRARLKSLERYADIIDIFNDALPELKGGEIKALWLILKDTIGAYSSNPVINNDDFIALGPHLTRPRDVINATVSLKDKGFIFRVLDTESDFNNYRYSINLKKTNLDMSE